MFRGVLGVGSLHAPLGPGAEAAFSAVRVRPPLAASVPAGGPHFDPPRREARGANLRIRARRLPGSGMAGCAERREA